MNKIVIAGAIGECVHIAGVINFLHLAEVAGWKTVFLGPATSIEDFISAIKQYHPDLVGVSYRLTPENGERLLVNFAEEADQFKEQGMRFVFGGTPPVVSRIQKLGFFEELFDGNQPDDEVLTFLKGEQIAQKRKDQPPQETIQRLLWKSPYPLIRHHFGLPTLAQTIKGIEEIADSGTVDIISLGIDQDAQENFYHPELQNRQRCGAGGVPVRSEKDYEQLYAASRRGNFPLMRTYSGTTDFVRLAEMYQRTIHNCWAAVPLFWFNLMDKRGPWDLEGSIDQHQRVIRWHAERAIPVELNEAHHWGMRDAPDVVYVVAGFLAAYNARALGVHDYIAQFMFNSPSGITDEMDLAKMLAIMDLIHSMENDQFRIWRQTRTGLLSYPPNQFAARAHLATSIYVQMSLKPHIVHVVSHVEADHIAEAQDVIEACLMASNVISKTLKGQPFMTKDKRIEARRKHLVNEAKTTIQAIQSLGSSNTEDPLTSPSVLTKAVRLGIMDAPHLQNNPFAKGQIKTSIINGACEAIDINRKIITESERMERLMKETT
jgi:hypothetical protein